MSKTSEARRGGAAEQRQRYWRLYERARSLGYTARELSGKTEGELRDLVTEPQGGNP